MGSKAKLDKSTSSRQANAINTGAEGLTKGSKVWLRGKGESAWELGELRSLEGTTAQVALDKTGKVVSLPLDQLVPANPRLQEGIPDLTHLSYLNEPGILYNLHFRYATDDIYTFAGPVLIAVNPCKSLPLYTSEVANTYKAGARDVVHSANMPPHIYLVAANAFRRMLREKTSQSLIVNGESGAGKTETTKKAMQYFATLAGGTGVEDQVLETNPILEAFGNAKTLRNHNSSRFGKLIQIHFNQGHHICGAAIKTYLLEKSRVVHQLPGERSYHIFYQLVRGASKAQKAEFLLPDQPTGFKFLSSSGCTDIEGVDDASEFRAVCVALTDIGIDAQQQAALFQLLAGVLWLGNLEFEEDPVDAANDATMIVQDAACAACCKLLGVTAEGLKQALTRKRIVTPGEIIVKLLNNEESRDCRDALAKALYAATFDWIVSRINAKLDTGKAKTSGLSIAILDIYGFEQFQKNSFEQLCINYANERLQQQFTRHLFTLEQQEYESEGIDWTKVDFIDNQECVDAMEATPPKGLGVLAVLDAQCRFPKATDDTFVHKLKEALSTHSHFEVNPRSPQDFTIIHYAGAVSYSSAGFLDKNKDTLNSDLIELMLSADTVGSPLVSQLGKAVKEETEANAKRGGQTVGSRFSQQLRELIAELDATGLHFVRCIKPNVSLKPQKWEEGMALHQLKCCGVLEVARIARAGYPTRYTHQAFAERYAILLPREQQAALLATASRRIPSGAGSQTDLAATPGALQACKQLLDMFRLNASQYQIGHTKIFFRPGVLGFVEDKWAAMQTSAVTIQAAFRMYRARSVFQGMRRAATLVQSSWRTIKEKRAYDTLKIQTRAARIIQCRWRAHHARVKYVRMRKAAVTIQMAWRRSRFGKKVRRRVFDREKREMMARLEQDKFESVRNQYGCDMDEVRLALAAWAAAKESAGGDGSGADMGAVMAEAQGKRGMGAGGVAAVGVAGAAAGAMAGVGGMALAMVLDDEGGGDAAASAVPRNQSMSPKVISPRESLDHAAAGTPNGTAPMLVGSPSGAGMMIGAGAGVAAGGAGVAAAAVAAARFAAAQEAKEAAEKLSLENMRLSKQLQLERSLKDRYQHKYEEQNGLWVEQIQVLQQYIQQVRAAFGDARLPPLPSALASATAPVTRSESQQRATGSDGGKRRSFGTTAVAGGAAAAAATGTAFAVTGADGGDRTPVSPSSPVHPAPAAPTVWPTDSVEASPVVAAAAPAAAAVDGQDWGRKHRGSRSTNERAGSGAARAAAAAGMYTTHGGDSDEEGQEEEVQTPASNGHNGAAAMAGTRGPGGVGRGMGLELEMPPEENVYPEDVIVSPSRPVVPVQKNGAAAALPRSQAVGVQRPAGGPAAKYVSQLDGELSKVQQVLDDDVGFISEVAAGVIPAPDMDPSSELNRLRKKFDLWRKEFKDKLTTAEEVLRKLDRMPQAQHGYGSGGHAGRHVPHQVVNGHTSHAMPARQEVKQSGGFMGKLFKNKG